MAIFEFDPTHHTVPAWRVPADRARGIIMLTEDAETDWHAIVRDCVAEASVLADRIGTRDSEAGEAIQRLCNVVVHPLDENERRDRAQRPEAYNAVGGL